MNTIELIKSKLEEIGFSEKPGSILYSENRLIKLISTPHLSRDKIDAKGKLHGDAYDTRPALDWFRNEISKILKNDS